MFLKDEPCMIRPIHINLNTLELKYYSLIISLSKYTRSYKISFQKICVPKETKDMYVKC